MFKGDCYDHEDFIKENVHSEKGYVVLGRSQKAKQEWNNKKGVSGWIVLCSGAFVVLYNNIKEN